MYVSVIHTIHDAASFQSRAQRVTEQAPAGITPVQFLPDSGGVRAVCLWRADTVGAVQLHIDGVLGDAATQEYFAVAEQYAVGLPVAQGA